MERFQFLSTQEIDSRVRRGVPEGTKKSTTFALRVYEEWVTARNSAYPDAPLPSLDELLNVPNETFSQALSRFVFEIRRKDGKEYPSGSIHGIMCGVMRYFRDDCNRPDLNFFKEENGFHQLRRCIDRRKQELSEKRV